MVNDDLNLPKYLFFIFSKSHWFSIRTENAKSRLEELPYIHLSRAIKPISIIRRYFLSVFKENSLIPHPLKRWTIIFVLFYIINVKFYFTHVFLVKRLNFNINLTNYYCIFKQGRSSLVVENIKVSLFWFFN